ncbi:MAG: CDP-glycerol glycerophosphotransferase family protein [Prevotella sp.]|nr:CDP-glycerol glycerophosphotransferase family protein [Prevotella sp.]
MNRKHLILALRHLLFKILNISFSVFPIKKNRVFFVSFNGKSYSDNPKAISKALFELYHDSFEHVWVLNNTDVTIPGYIHTCKNNSLKMIYYLATSKVWVSNFLLPKGTYKRKKQYYIQTWHGDKAFKKILHDVPSRDGSKKWLFETDHTDLMVAGSQYGVNQMRTAFLYNGKILEEGTPRNDLFFKDNHDLKVKLRNILHCTDGEKLIMYAPTFRREEKTGLFDAHFDFKQILSILKESTGSTWKFLVRTHSADRRMKIVTDDSYMIDVSNYPDMNELLLITDMLITDYSSVAGDYALLEKPILLFQYDKDRYLEKDREFYFDMKDSPYFVATNENELYHLLEDINSVDVKKNCKDILSFYNDFETGHSSTTIVNLIYSLKDISKQTHLC